MLIRIIGEVHDEKDDVSFIDKAKKLARSGCIVLVLENEVFSDYKDGEIEKNVYAIEDKVIWEYNKVIFALYEIYPSIKRQVGVNDKNLLQIYQEIRETNITFERLRTKIVKDISDYIESYFSFLRNTEVSNPVSEILLRLMKEVVDNQCLGSKAAEVLCKAYQGSRSEVTQEFIILFIENIELFNKILLNAALIFREYILGCDYSKQIKTHPSLTDEWIKGYFNFRFLRRETSGLLDFDRVTVDLRNQVFIEKLNQLASKSAGAEESRKEIWFIVGEEHLRGLEELSRQYGNLNVKVILRSEKQELLTIVCSADIEIMEGEKGKIGVLPAKAAAKFPAKGETKAETHRAAARAAESPKEAAKAEVKREEKPKIVVGISIDGKEDKILNDKLNEFFKITAKTRGKQVWVAVVGIPNACELLRQLIPVTGKKYFTNKLIGIGLTEEIDFCFIEKIQPEGTFFVLRILNVKNPGLIAALELATVSALPRAAIA